jgi:hypothetical protein
LREKKKSIEEEFQREMSKDFTKLDDLKIDLESDQELMNDLAINQLMDGKTVEVVDQYENKYSPLFTVKFKKS